MEPDVVEVGDKGIGGLLCVSRGRENHENRREERGPFDRQGKRKAREKRQQDLHEEAM